MFLWKNRDIKRLWMASPFALLIVTDRSGTPLTKP
jgi:hypothetical protein